MSNMPWVAALGVLAALPATVCACLWDYDTIQQERSRFPGTLELITGKFLRHSPEFYYWRIRDREARVQAGATDPGLYDDLGVAYEMTGQHTKAIEVMAAKEKLHPGLYETYSNLGTFHILAGDFEKGLPLIDKALAINPDAHFGREKYQQWLVEYALTRRKEGKLVFPMCAANDPFESTFTHFVTLKVGEKTLSLPERQKAVKGVLGMMRFARHDNPLLLEALADLLLHDQTERTDGQIDAKQLAARSYLKAAYGASDAKLWQTYRELADRAIRIQTVGVAGTQLKLDDLDVAFKSEQADADVWYADLKRKELAWIEDGKDADAEFDKLYDTDPALIAEKESKQSGWWDRWWGLIGLFSGLMVLLLWLWWRMRSSAT
jgi:tetratricopeptide (TPR) repeat protein